MAEAALNTTDAAVQREALLFNLATSFEAVIVAAIQAICCAPASAGSDGPGSPGSVHPGSIATLLDRNQYQAAIRPQTRAARAVRVLSTVVVMWRSSVG